MITPKHKYRVGELRPSQLLFSYGVGAIVDLPHLSTMVLGLDDWETAYATEIGEERLRAAVQEELGAQVTRLLAPPAAPETGPENPLDTDTLVGVPVATFPRWVVCPYCHLLAPLNSGLFELKTNVYRPDQTRYVHVNCRAHTPPTVLPARFLVACPYGHLDDFPWLWFVHGGETACRGPLHLVERGVSGEAADIRVVCDALGCGKNRSLAEAFGPEGQKNLPACAGRRPHLRDWDETPCAQPQKAILMGASNSWFPIALTALSVPVAPDRLGQLVEAHWHVLEKATSLDVLTAFRLIGQLAPFGDTADAPLWEAIERRRAGVAPADARPALKTPEWQVFTRPTAEYAAPDFRIRAVPPPAAYSPFFSRVVLVERLREVRALIGFTRIESPGEFGEIAAFPEERRAPLARRRPRWVPAAEVRGEGIFLQFEEAAIQAWEQHHRAIGERNRQFVEAHRRWRRQRLLDPAVGYPGMRYFLLHSFAHALMRQLALECGYSAASIRERIYCLPPQADDGPMAGVLLYTAAPDSEGTLGGLVSLGVPEELGRLLDAALEGMELCAADPLCAEHEPGAQSAVLHGAACHACLFAPETSCERGNKYLDRSVLVPTVEHQDLAFFAEGTAQ